MDPLTLAGFLGLVCTKLVDGIKHAIPRKVPDFAAILLSIGLGVLFAGLLELDLCAELRSQKVISMRGVMLTGLIIGGLGSGFYEVMDIVSTKTSQLKDKHKVRRGQMRAPEGVAGDRATGEKR